MRNTFSQSLRVLPGYDFPLVSQCYDCGFHKKCQTPKMKVFGKGKRNILVIGDRPGLQEDKQGKPFIGRVGRYLSEVVRKVGYDLWEDCYLTNALICYSPNDTKAEVAVGFCRPNVIDVVTEIKPSVVLVLGGLAVQSVIGWLWKDTGGESKDNKSSISRWIGWQIPSQKVNAWICPSWNPSYLLRSAVRGRIDPILELLFERHVQEAFSLESRPWRKVIPYDKQVRHLYNESHLSETIRSFIGERPIAFDYETDRLKPDHTEASIYCCAISDGRRTIAYPWHGESIQATSEILRSDTPKLGWNIKFEERWTRRILGHKVKNWVWDGMVNSHLMDNRTGITSLKFQAFVQLGVGSYDDEIKPYLKNDLSNEKNRIKEAPLDQVLTYNGMDALLEWKLCTKQRKELSHI